MLRNLIVTLVALGVAACSSNSGPSTRIVMGAVIDKTGSEAESSWVQAMQLAVSQLNEAMQAEGHNDFQFALESQDSENIPAKGVARALDMVNNQHSKVLMVDTTQVTEAVLSTFYDDDPTNDLGVPVQCSACTSGNLLNYTYDNPAVGGAADPTATPVLDNVRRNTGLWHSRTTMTTVPMAFVAAYVLNNRADASGAVAGLDRNHDGIVKLATLGSNEPFGTAGTNALRANMPAVVGRSIAMDATGNLFVERIFHSNDPTPSNVDFNAPDPNHNNMSLIERLTDNVTECESCAAVSGVVPPASIADGHPVDYIVVITFQQFAANFVANYKLGGAADATGIPVLHYHTFRQSGSLFQLGALANGQFGISHGLVNISDSGGIYTNDFVNAYGFNPNFWDAGYYDNVMTFMLATLIAQVETGTVADVDPTIIRDRIQCTSANQIATYAPPANYPNPQPWTNCRGTASITHTGPGIDNLRTAVREIFAGRAIDYDGASGPMDYDFQKNVRDTVEYYEVQNSKFVTQDKRTNQACAQGDTSDCVYNCLSFSDNKCGVTTPITVP